MLSGMKQDCIVLNDLAFITLKPNFMIVLPDITDIDSPGGGTMGTMIMAAEAQQMEYKSIEKGKCSAKTYFFGRPKPGRTFDFILRAFEQGFSISKCQGLKTLPPDAIVEITVAKRAKYTELPPKEPGGQKRLQKNMKVPCRVRRVK